jgi:hypothetical protein
MTAPAFLTPTHAERLVRIQTLADEIDPDGILFEVYDDGTASVLDEGTAYLISDRGLFTNYPDAHHTNVHGWTKKILALSPGLYQGRDIYSGIGNPVVMKEHDVARVEGY